MFYSKCIATFQSFRTNLFVLDDTDRAEKLCLSGRVSFNLELLFQGKLNYQSVSVHSLPVSDDTGGSPLLSLPW